MIISFHKSFEFRLVLLCMTALISVIAIVHIAVYLTVRNMIEDEITQNAQGIAVAVARYVEKDINAYKAFISSIESVEIKNTTAGLEPGDYQHSGYYQNMQDFFADIKAHSHVKYIYTERIIDDKTIEFILDAEPIGAEDHSPPRSTGPNDPYRAAAYSTGQPIGFKLVAYARWGKLLGGYAPIFDEDRKTLLGIAGVNIDASHLHKHLNKLQAALFVVYAFIICAALWILVKYSDVILEPLLRDKLTGAYNKRYFEKLLFGEMTIALKGRKDLALLILDLDHFKKINDTYGHHFGDIVLSSVSATIRNSLRQHDHFIRYGGEEFIAIIPNTNEKLALEIAERIRIAVEKNEIRNEEKDISVKMTISIGVAGLNSPSLSIHEFVKHADKALYAAKKTRNCVAILEPNEEG